MVTNAHRLVQRGIAVERRDHAERQTDQDRDDDRRDRQLEGCRQPRQEIGRDRTLRIDS